MFKNPDVMKHVFFNPRDKIDILWNNLCKRYKLMNSGVWDELNSIVFSDNKLDKAHRQMRDNLY